MMDLLKKFETKLICHGLCEEGQPLLGSLDDELYWNRTDLRTNFLEEIFHGLNISSILFAKPAEPYFTILNALADEATCGFFVPEDSESRTFFHDIPVTDVCEAPAIIAALKRRRSIFVKGHGILTYGTIGPEQAFVVFSSVCFSSYVKFFSDLLSSTSNDLKRIEFALREAEHYLQFLTDRAKEVCLQSGPFHTRNETRIAITDAGRATVQCRLVDSYFGNISYFNNDSIFISQTASSLDELSGCIDECPIDGSSCEGITASSEFTAHREIFMQTNARAILHGHPKFSVIMSMQCGKKPCEFKDECHRRCPENRSIEDIPIVPGEIGTGKYGLCNTLPPALKYAKGAIVYGHGLFTTGRKDFREAFNAMKDIETMCVKSYINLLQERG